MSFIPFFSKAQVIADFPIDENGKIKYTDVITLDSVSAKELYLRSKKCFGIGSRSVNDVIQVDEKESGLLIGKDFTDLVINGTFVMSVLVGDHIEITTQLWYSIRIQSKDYRYKYEIYDIYFQSYPNKYSSIGYTTPAEKMFDKGGFKKNGKPNEVQSQYINQTKAKIDFLIAAIKETMTKPIISKDDW